MALLECPTLFWAFLFYEPFWTAPLGILYSITGAVGFVLAVVFEATQEFLRSDIPKCMKSIFAFEMLNGDASI